MADIVDSQTRSRMMAGIKGKDTRPEMIVRRFLHAQGFRYRLHDNKLPGKPDIVLPKYKLAILVHGCFWHQHNGCRFATTPEQNLEKWQEKFRQNVERDRRQMEQLLAQGWRVAVLWECGLRSSTPDLLWLTEFVKKGHLQSLEWPI